MIKTLRNSLLAYVVTSIVGLPFVSNLAIADALSVTSGIDLGSIIQNGVSVNYDHATGLVSSGGQEVIVYDKAADGMAGTKAAYGDKGALGAVVAGSMNTLHSENSDAGSAYRTLMGGAGTPRPNLANDPMVTNGEAAMRDTMNTPASGGCYVTTQTNEEDDGSTRMQENKTCDRYTSTTTECKVSREIRMWRPVTALGGATGNDLGMKSHEITMGVSGLESIKACASTSHSATIRVNAPSKIVSATLHSVGYDDRVRVKVDGNIVFTGPDSNFASTPVPATTTPPAPATTTCNLGSSTSYPGVDLTSHFTSKGAGGIVTVTLDMLYENAGMAYAKIVFAYADPEQIIHQTPSECMDDILADPDFLGEPDDNWPRRGNQNDQASDGNWECLSSDHNRTIPTQEGGTYIVTPNDFTTIGALYPNEPGPSGPICYEAELRKLTANTECQDETNGTKCTTVNWVDNPDANSCGELSTNPSCTFTGSECQEKNKAGECVHYEDTYDCGVDVQNTKLVSSEVLTCPGGVSCMGESCGISRPIERNGRFKEAAGAMETIKNANMDMKCDPNMPEQCRIFGGEALRCKNIFSGLQDCCGMDPPPGPSLKDYLSLASAGWKVMEDTKLGQELASVGNGLWKDLSTPVTNLATEMSKSLVTAWDSFIGAAEAGSGLAATGAEAAATVAQTAVTEVGAKTITQKLTNYAVEWATETFGSSIAGNASSLFVQDAAGNMVLNTAGNLAASFISFVMWVYAIYTIINILVNLIWPCTEEEFKLASKKEMRLCHYAGKKTKRKLGIKVWEKKAYCCFGSPFARIMHQQGRDWSKQPAVNKPWGGYKYTDCSGFTLQEFASIDFDKVDLSEWLALLRLTDVRPTTSVDKMNDVASAENAGRRRLADDKLSASAAERTKGLISAATGGSESALDERRQQLQEAARDSALLNQP